MMQRENAEIVVVELHDGLMHLLRKAWLLSRGDGPDWVFPSATDINEPYS